MVKEKRRAFPPAPRMAAAPAPKYWWFQPQEQGRRILVEASLFKMDGTLPSIPPGCWFALMFGRPESLPMPLTEVDGLPVYALPLPALVLEALLHGVRFAKLLPQMHMRLPPVLRGVLELETWQQYLEFYLGVPELPVSKRPREDVPSDAAEPPAKKPRVHDERLDFIRRFATRVANRILEEHASAAGMRTGLYQAFTCQFPAGYSVTVQLQGVDNTMWFYVYDTLLSFTAPEIDAFKEALIAAFDYPCPVKIEIGAKESVTRFTNWPGNEISTAVVLAAPVDAVKITVRANWQIDG